MQLTTSLDAQIQCVEHSDGSIGLKSSGRWVVDALENAIVVLNQCLTKHYAVSIQWDVSSVHHYDSAGMLLFIHYYDALTLHHCSIDVIGITEKHEKMYHLVRRYKSDERRLSLDSSFFSLKFLTVIGKKTVFYFQDLSAFLYFVGESFVSLLYSARHPRSIRVAAIVKNIEEAGVRAIPIVALTSFLIGIVIAYQGAVQLQKFGANIFIVDMIALSVTRELAPLITAIVVAGRTGSAYTAQLGVMKITEEIDAMRTMGFDPHRFLVLPRILALILALPLMIFFADLVGILGGMFIANIHLHLSYSEFLNRLQSVLEAKHVWIGIIKGPFFAWLIAAVGCFRGFQVSNNTDSIGRYTTVSVVNAIFLVIACDAIFSVILTELGI